MNRNRNRTLILALSVLPTLFLIPIVSAAETTSSVSLPGLREPARITRDLNGIAHIQARNAHDLYFLQGNVHAQDRLFQMDYSRRLASGTLAELLGPGALESDVPLRTLGLRRAAQRSLAVISTRTRAGLAAYAEGVNAFAAANPLPPEYALLELSRFEPWTPLDSMAIAKLIAFGRSFELDIDLTVALLSYEQAGGLVGFDGTKLFFEDLFRSAPFDPAATIPDAMIAVSRGRDTGAREAYRSAGRLHPRTLDLGRRYLERVKDFPLFRAILDRDHREGSNEWAVAGAHTANGYPLLANDNHLALGVPSTFYPIHLRTGALDVTGSGFAGAPFIIEGSNRYISWGTTDHPMDVTDTFQERIAPDLGSSSGLSIVHDGRLEPILPIPEVFRQNHPGNGLLDDLTVVPPGGPIPVPAATLIVPRRNDGPIIQLDLEAGVALSAQFSGFGPTREMDTFRIWNEAKGLDDFVRGLQFLDFGSQSVAYSDVHGNIAYFTSGEMPLREDLQAGVVHGLPPFFIRDGTGGNEWLPARHPQPGQALPYEILPFDEMPHLINPPAGWFVNANNDPAGITRDNDPLNQLRPGGGIYYLAPGYDRGFRAGRITRLIRERLSGGGKISFSDMQEIQADTAMADAEVFVPYLLQAFARAQAGGAHPALAGLAANPSVRAGIDRLRGWDFTTPTGIPEGYDSGDRDGILSPPADAEIGSSVAAAIYGVWRSRFLRSTIDAPLAAIGLPLPGSQQSLAALRRLLDDFEGHHGVGASGLNFFNVPGVLAPADRRDILILRSLADALADLAGPSFAPAFGYSADLNDYRWGRLHRLVLEHPLGGPFSIPPAGGAFPPPLPGLAGIPTDGGFQTVDAANHDARADHADAFLFHSGPVQRFVTEAEAAPGRMRAESSLPGGTSGVLGSPYYLNLLPAWLTNEAFPLRTQNREVRDQAASVTEFLPAKQR